jgi:general secretion pathway protein L
MQLAAQKIRPILDHALRLVVDGLRWWRAELLGMVPVSLQARLGLLRPRMTARLAGETLELAIQSANRSAVVYRGPAEAAAIRMALDAISRPLQRDRFDVILSLPRSEVLVRQIELPVAARSQIERALAFELSRQTPLDAGEAYFDWQILGEMSGRLQILLAVVERGTLDRKIDHLRGCNLSPVKAEIEDGLPAAAVNLLRQTRIATPLKATTLATAILSVLLVVLSVTMAELAVARRETVLADLTAEVRKERATAIEVEALRKELVEADRRVAFLSDKLNSRSASISVHQLSSLLPNDTWLYQLQIQNGEIRLHGYVPDAARLIDILETSNRFRNTQFRSPSTRRSGTELDRFDVSTVLTRSSIP